MQAFFARYLAELVGNGRIAAAELDALAFAFAGVPTRPSDQTGSVRITGARAPAHRSHPAPFLSGTAPRGRVPVVVATTVFLSFISFWRAAAIVLADLGSSAFYAGGIAEHAVGKAAPWFILGVMLFSYAVRAIYIESSVMFVRGGVYRVVKEAMGPTFGKLSVSALLFDYVLTGPISGVSAGQYIVGLVNDVTHRLGVPLNLPPDATAAILAIGIILYFWRRNTVGLHESSSDALRIVQITTVMVVILLAWSAMTLLLRGGHLPPPPTLANIQLLGRCARLAAGNAAAGHHRDRRADRPRPLVPRHERLGVAGPGVPGDRAPQAAESPARGDGRLRLQRRLHDRRQLPGGRVDPRPGS